ncbi:MAG: 50S ribosomal protein L4 [Thermoplasmata archaeon]|nr:50S ribosomal protein L4 [Thermoplasmata archaeon]
MPGAKSDTAVVAAHHDDSVVHHRVPVLSLDGKVGEPVALPIAFSTPLRPDLIHRAVIAAQARRRQPHGTSPTAGNRHSVEWSGKGKGVARTPRLMDSNRGAQAPNTVGGRPTHPPRIETIWEKKINLQERHFAFASALAATRDLKVVRERGHDLPEDVHLPVVFVDALESVDTASRAQDILSDAKVWSDVQRSRDGTHVRAGRGKRRGRTRQEPKSLLVVTSGPRQARGFRNFPGVDVVWVGRLGTEDLAPGGAPGRLTIFSTAALTSLKNRMEAAA